jgi:hypothetical protein
MDRIGSTPKLFQTFVERGRLHTAEPKPLDMMGDIVLNEASALLPKLELIENNPALNLNPNKDQFKITESDLDAINSWDPEQQTLQDFIGSMKKYDSHRFYVGSLQREGGKAIGFEYSMDENDPTFPTVYTAQLAKLPSGTYYVDTMSAPDKLEVRTGHIAADGKRTGESLVTTGPDAWNLA